MSFSQVNCSGASVRKGRLYQQCKGKPNDWKFDNSAKAPKAKPLEIVFIASIH